MKQGLLSKSIFDSLEDCCFSQLNETNESCIKVTVMIIIINIIIFFWTDFFFKDLQFYFRVRSKMAQFKRLFFFLVCTIITLYALYVSQLD